MLDFGSLLHFLVPQVAGHILLGDAAEVDDARLIGLKLLTKFRKQVQKMKIGKMILIY
jgi:hypothetical protein